ncbi:MAG: hypothetical protein ACSHWZ_15820 [Sulfitobacter sp.]
MMIRAAIGVLSLAGLVACQPVAPEDSNFGTGYNQTFEAQKANRDAQLAGSGGASPLGYGSAATAVPAAPGVSTVPLSDDAALAADTARILAQTDPSGAAANSGVAPVAASPSNPAPPVVNAAGISQENSFDAVAGQRSIQDDAARAAANRAQYEVVQPEALPTRGDVGPNVVSYALSTSHPVGSKRYSRFGFNKQSKFQRNCAEEASANQAQQTFLSLGGPEKDPRGLDPDGDGYACAWSPADFRRAAAAASQ